MPSVAIIGCGRIADLHALQIRRIPGARLVAACDHEVLMARQFCERFAVSDSYDDPDAMLAAKRPDVVHITTPPQSHGPLARRCLSSGAHVYVEKPFALNLAEAEELLAHARASQRRITAGHNVQFTEPAMRLRAHVSRGDLGGAPVHMESVYCYDLGDLRYVRAMVGDRDHWVRRLPGRLFHNIVSHGIAKIAEFLPGDDPEVLAVAFASPALVAAGAEDLKDELRVLLRDPASGVTANFLFSTRQRPLLHQFRIYGPDAGVMTDDDHMQLVHLPGRPRKSYLNYVLPQLATARQHVSSAFRNLGQLVSGELHNDVGMKNLVEAFYRAISDGAPDPIPHREILATTRIMDRIFGQIHPSHASAP